MKIDPTSQLNIMDTRLLGIWHSDEKDEATRNSIGKVSMNFTKDGQLFYEIYEKDKIQRMNLIYQVNGDIIISDQPSHPQKQETKYWLENDNKLILEFEGEKTIFNRTIE